MKELVLRDPIESKNGANVLTPVARRLVLGRLKLLTRGRLDIHENGRVTSFGNDNDACSDANSYTSTVAIMVIVDSRAFEKIAFGGAIGAAEAYMAGDWYSEDLTAMLRLLLQNRQVLEGLEKNSRLLKRPLYKLFHWLRRDTLVGSKKNISAHYDLGNELFKLFLDPTLTYSSGYFETPDDSMEQASIQKIDLICQKLKLSANDRILEIGSGWGSLAIHAATHYGCHVTTTTISQEQYAHVVQAVEAAMLTDKIRVLKKDYRHLEGEYDKIVSVEMIEAVGLKYIPAFFQTCSSLLAEGGSMLIQTITIADQRYDQAKNSVDFIQRYIFPGGALPSVTSLAESSANHSDLRVYALEDITAHYGETIVRWRNQFEDNLDAIKQLGCEDIFLRMWRYYLCYCEAGFKERAIGCVHIQFHKPAFENEISPS